jgi:CO/xanthine dehydrogenase FAD-binding subunit
MNMVKNAVYVRPQKLEEAVELMSTDTWRILAGGTDIYPSIGESVVKTSFMDLTNVSSLKGFTEDQFCWKIGALATWTDLLKTKLPPAFDALKQAAREIGSLQIQNRATIVGNICNASPAADGVPPLLILDASIELTSINGFREVALKDFITGNREIARDKNEIVSCIKVPKIDLGSRSVFKKLGVRKYLVISITMVALKLSIGESGTIKRATLAVGACSAVAKRLLELEYLLEGKTTAEAGDLINDTYLADLTPITDVRATANYRKVATKILIQRSISSFENRNQDG